MFEPYPYDPHAVKLVRGGICARRLDLITWVAVLGIFFGPTPTLAQSNCNTRQFSRFGEYEGRLAVKVGDNWTEPFHANPEGPRHKLEVTGDDDETVCLAWEAPSHFRPSRQFVYASTEFTDRPFLNLYRKGIFGEQEQPLDRYIAGELKELIGTEFRNFHTNPADLENPADSDSPTLKKLKKSLKRWHVGGARLERWHESSTSYKLVSHALTGPSDRPYGAERLLTLLPLRPWKSWVAIESRAPKPKGTLRVAIAYSGDPDDKPLIYQYSFVAIRSHRSVRQ